MIDGIEKEYEDYIPNSLNKEEYLNQQIRLIKEANDRLLKIFK